MNTTTQVSSIETRLMDAFASQADRLPMPALQRAAMDRFLGLGIPVLKSEAYKYTPIRHAFKTEFAFTPETADPHLSAYDSIDLTDAHEVVLVNGRFSEADSRIGNLPEGVAVISLKTAFQSHAALLESVLGQAEHGQKDAFYQLNTAFAEDGLFVYVPENTQLTAPIHLRNVTTAQEAAFFNSRMVVIAEAYAGVEIIESRLSQSTSPTFFNAVTEIQAAAGANVSYYLVQDSGSYATEVNGIFSTQAENSVVSTYTLTVSGQTVRNNSYYLPNAEACETNLYSVLVGTGAMHVDNATFVDHAMPNCNSNELYKHLLTDKATGVFNGRILVRQDAQKTNAYQSNKTILISDEARIFSKPELEIYADDVKCSHGAATGKMDDDAMFYLRARGLNKAAARKLLMVAFAGEVTDKIEIEAVKAFWNDAIAARI